MIDNSIHAAGGIHCQGCEQHLPLRMSGPAEVATLWECAACGTAFAGVLVPDLVAAHAKRVRLAQLHFDVEHTEPLGDNFRTAAVELNARPVNPEFIEQRRSPREARQLDAVAIGFGAGYMLVGPTCRGIVANLSSHGMLLTTAVPLKSPAVAVQMCGGGEKIQLLGRIVRPHDLGNGCYGNGVEFISRLGKVPAAPNAADLSAASPY
jgi:hypothetical protein